MYQLRSNILLAIVALLMMAQIGLAQFPCNSNTPSPCLTIGPIPSSPVPSPPIPAGAQGWIVGEIRAFAFGIDSTPLIKDLEAKGWVECRGQYAVRKDFGELLRAIGTNWGAPTSNEFFVPDLRGLTLRGWNHDRAAPPRYMTSPYLGDRDMSSRVKPRPEEDDAAPTTPGANPGSFNPTTGSFDPNHVGSLQADQVGKHRHFVANATAISGAIGSLEFTSNTSSDYPPTHYTDDSKIQKEFGNETHPTNAYVMYFIYTGRPAAVIDVPAPALNATAAERAAYTAKGSTRLCRLGDTACINSR